MRYKRLSYKESRELCKESIIAFSQFCRSIIILISCEILFLPYCEPYVQNLLNKFINNNYGMSCDHGALTAIIIIHTMVSTNGYNHNEDTPETLDILHFLITVLFIMMLSSKIQVWWWVFSIMKSTTSFGCEVHALYKTPNMCLIGFVLTLFLSIVQRTSLIVSKQRYCTCYDR